MRTKIISLGIIFIFLFLELSFFNLGIIQSNKFKTLSDKNCIRLLAQEGSRGRILDRQGDVIVDSYLSYDVMVLSQDNHDPDKTLMNVSKILGVSVKDLKDEYKNSFMGSSLPVPIAKNIDIKKAIALEELKPDLGDIIIQPHPLRHYPYNRLACHLIGYLSEIDRWRLTKLADYGYKTKDIVGYTGVEEKYDYYLRQEEGALSMQVDHRGRFIRLLGFRPPHNGKDIQLTLDLRIQKIVEDALQDNKGCVIIMDPYNGEIIAMASRPDFNPAIFVKKSGSSITNLFNEPLAPLLNRAISGVYPPASVFKLVLVTGGLETGKINPSTTFNCAGSIYIGRRQFSCWDVHHEQNLMGGIIHSCDVFFYRTGLTLGAQVIHDYALKLGFSKAVPIDLPYGLSGFVPDPLWKRIYKFRNWFDGDTANLAIGQGDVLVTPLQMVRMMAVFVNKGILVNPYIVKAVDGKDISVYQKKTTMLAIKESTVNYIRQALRKVVSDPSGTANVLSDLEVPVAGKTGTAQVSSGLAHGWFLGFFPFKNPKFVICVLLEHVGHGYASAVLARQIIEEMYKEGLIAKEL